MTEENQKWVDDIAGQVDVLNSIQNSFSGFAASLKERHAELQGSVPKIEYAVSEIQTTVQNAARKSEKAAQDIAAATEKLSKNSGGEFALWQKEAAKAREQIEAVVGEISANVKAVEETLTGIRDAVDELHEVENKVFTGIRDSIGEVKDAVERNTKAKVGDYSGALQNAPVIGQEDVDKLRGEISALKDAIESLKTDMIAAKAASPVENVSKAASGDVDEVERFNSGVVADELSEIKSMMFEMIRYMKIVGERKIEVRSPEPPAPGGADELAERMASGYRDLVKLMVERKSV